ncbi:flagellar filament capping protein FliD [Solimonas sp. SE-A11]|uniref:flagellar filament capping protein FliD n=1 Tax=Solimonas sp. SE-A11 TaxID=3054954 RepID=UPI00259D17D6|nr:flagellar filament capping protein FliD [Solimonas sp. SE-A11]MDM4771908.1 flagellar filament capping protein FliD [Solimonas sp. SE-A11]
MATSSINASSFSSGLDVVSLVAQLVAVDRAKPDARIAAAQSKAQTRLSALGVMKSALSNLQTTAKTLVGGGAVATPAVKSSREDLFTATTAPGAARGSFAVEVVSLAQSSKLISGPVASADTILGAGDVDITVGDKSFKVTLGSTDNSLGALRDAINKATDNPGVTASLVTESGGVRLLLTGNQTGASQAVSVSSSLISLNQTQAAADAHVKVEGFDVYSASNTVTGALDGVTLNLVKAEPGTTGTLALSTDNSASAKAVQDFVTKYNQVLTTINNLTKYDAATKTASTLTGDSTVRQTAAELRSIMSGSAPGGAYSYLTQLGIKTGSDGLLSVDSAKLNEAIAKDSGSIARMFGGDDGYATRMSKSIDAMLADNAGLDAQTDTLQARLKDIEKQKDALDRRMTQVEARYTAQFTALDTLMTRMSTTSNYLTQQLAAIANNN